MDTYAAVAEKGTQWPVRRNDEKVGDDMTDPFIPEEEAEAVKKRATISLEEERLGDVRAIAQFWNEYAEIQGKRRVPKWKVSSVVERMLYAQLDAFWSQVGVTAGMDADARKKRLQQILAEAKAKRQGGKKKS